VGAVRYEHAEAFCLMTYQANDGTEQEVIWNSRDGVTPFVIRLRNGKEASHVTWKDDRCDPDHKPQPGDRIFVDLTPERAREVASTAVDRWLADPGKRDHVLAVYINRDQAIERQIRSLLSQPSQPDLIEVQP
jgi:hypothetical protein